MIGWAYALLSLVVFFGGAILFVVAFEKPGSPGPLSGLPDLRQPARWVYAVVAISSLAIALGDIPKSRRNAHLLWIVQLDLVFEGVLWPFALARRVAPDAWESDEY